MCKPESVSPKQMKRHRFFPNFRVTYALHVPSAVRVRLGGSLLPEKKMSESVRSASQNSRPIYDPQNLRFSLVYVYDLVKTSISYLLTVAAGTVALNKFTKGFC